ncbi:hypothetical protein [Dermatobacter hominis]|uniref:hypothetical protein n=1 Tax=Dermatobacter hominis TaxID=2884263 RepID=UPI001D100E7C|nr:hypothetical protein [Dermatobacter hominis]UDY34999.1 hypothetical protein LH044_16875 [Dermatobacter hominis]
MSQHVVVRPTIGLYLRRVFNSNDGKLLLFAAVLVPAIGFGVSPALGVGLTVLVLAGAAFALLMTKASAEPGTLVVSGPFRRRSFRVEDVTAVHLQPISYVFFPGGTPIASSYRMYVTASDGGKPVEAPVFATERHRQEDVQAIVGRLLAAAQSSPA